MNAKATELLKTAEFLKKVLPMEPAEALKAFEAEGAEITIDELNELAAEINKGLENSGEGELSAEALENVAGGKMDPGLFWFAVGVGVGIGITCAPW